MDSGKRPRQGRAAMPAPKKKKGGNQGKWQTPRQKAAAQQTQQGSIEAGDVGIWVTCARSLEPRAIGEIRVLFDEYAEKMYGVGKPRDAAQSDDEDEEDEGDIEASIAKELASLKPTSAGGPKPLFNPVRMTVDCLLFTKTQAPIEPVEFVKRICQDAFGGSARKTRYLNRLTPITKSGKASEAAIEETARSVLAQWFQLKDVEESLSEPVQSKPTYTYAIRPTIRNSGLKRDPLINKIASLIDDRHKVNLKSPDKVILVEVYQTVCGMSVVDSDWDKLKRYNLYELFNKDADGSQGAKEGGQGVEKGSQGAKEGSQVAKEGDQETIEKQPDSI